jgi:hypothetical protein
MEIAKIILEYFKVLLAWPVMAFIISMVFLFRFTDSIKHFIEKHYLRKFGSAEFESQNRDTLIQEKLTTNTNGEIISLEQMKSFESELEKLRSNISTKHEEIQQKDGLIDFLIYRAEYFEFSYLNLFYVLNTKNVLLWFFSVRQATKDFFSLTYQSVIQSPFEREAIFNALLNYEMIKPQDNGMVCITDKGIRFLKYIGYLK